MAIDQGQSEHGRVILSPTLRGKYNKRGLRGRHYMATASSAGAGDAGILSRLLEPDEPTLTLTACRWILGLKFSRADRVRMRELAVKGQAGELTPAEEGEVEEYRRVGQLLSLLKARARKGMKNGRRRS